MSTENMPITDENRNQGSNLKSELKTHEKNLKESIKTDEITEDDIKNREAAADFLSKNKNDEKLKDEIKIIEDNYKLKIRTNIIDDFWTKNQDGTFSIKTKKIDEQTNATIDAYMNILTRIGETDPFITTIKDNLTEQKTKLEEENLQNQEAAEKQKVIDILSSTEPKVLFETGSEQDFITVMKYLYWETTEKTISKTTTDAYEIRLLELINLYMQPSSPITSITIGQAKKGWFAKEYKEGTWMIEYTEKNEKKHISRGSNKHLEELKAEQAVTDGNISKEKNVFAVDFDGNKKWIAYFDKDMGNYAGLEKFLDIQGTEYVKNYLPVIMKWINEYTTVVYETQAKDVNPTHILDKTSNTYRPAKKIGDMWPDGVKLTEGEVATHSEKKLTNLNETEAKNGYADVLTKYIIDNKNNPELLKTYLEGLNSQNLNLLGVDQATRTKNYNALFFADVQNKILHPEIQAYINGLDDTQKKAFAEKIGAIKLGIDGVEKTSSVETLKKAANGVLKMLLGLFQQLGIGKATLSRRFGEENVSKLFLEEYGLNDKDKTQTITDISKKMTGEIDETKRQATIDAYKNGTFPSWGDIQKSFDKDKEEYITEITKEENVKYINPAVLKKCLDTYNKDNGTTLSILDIITTEKKDGKDIINTIKDPNNLKNILTHYLDKDAVWTEIAAANKSIGSPTKIDTIVQTYNESGIDIDTAIQKYCITNNQDTARFLTASFFSDKHLESTITTNELHNDKEIITSTSNKPDEVVEELTEAKITFKDGDKFVKDWIVTAAWWAKKIHDVIEMTTAPDKIKVNWEIAIKKTIDWTVTYIPEWTTKNPLTIEDRVKIKEKDKIEAIQSPKYLYQENYEKIWTAMKNIKTTDTITYKDFDFTTDFKYDVAAITDKKDYQENLLTPISGILTDQEQFKLLFTDTKINDKLTAIWPIHLKNTFTMMDSTEPKKYTDLITNITDSATITAVNNTITITQTTWTITIGYTTDNKLETKREVKAAT